MATMQLLVLVPLLVSLLPSSLSTSLTFSLTYIDAPSSPLRSFDADPADLLQSMPLRDFVASGRAMRARLQKHRNRARPLVRKLSYMDIVGDFYLTIRVGTPPQDVILLVDTGSELIWSQCSYPCSTNCTHTKAPLFSFKQSSSFLTIPCDSLLCTNSLGFRAGLNCSSAASICIFKASYGDGSIAAGFVSLDSFHLIPELSKSMVFGCSTLVDTETIPIRAISGVMGLSQGPFSFTSQLFGTNTHLPKKFAHCLPDRLANLNAPGKIQFGSYELAVNLSYTPLVPSYSPLAEMFYFVQLEGISVGESLIKVAMSTGEGVDVGRVGTIFDSGTALTILEKSVYDEMVGEMKRQTAHLRPFASKSVGSDLCYKVPLRAEELPKLPLVTLHFAGIVDLELQPESILYPAYSDHNSIFLCLAFDKTIGTLNIIGNYQQQNYWVEYNLGTSHLGLAKASCARF